MINQKYLWLEILKFNNLGLIPAIVQDRQNGNVLILIKLDKNSLKEAVDTQKLGLNYSIEAILYDCDADALLIKVDRHDCKSDNLNWITYGW